MMHTFRLSWVWTLARPKGAEAVNHSTTSISHSCEWARGNFVRPVVLGTDDVRAFPDAPVGFRDVHAGVAQGQVVELADGGA